MGSVFESLTGMGHEQLVYCHDQETGLKAIIGIHDTTLGPALGGTRLWPYHSEEEAVRDVLRLSRGMTYKAACAGIPLGGGKAVIISKPEEKSERMFRAYGRFVDSLGGRYITAEDVNISVQDMDTVRMETRYVTGVSKEFGGSGNPAPVTAFGVYQGMKAAVQLQTGASSLKGLRIAIQGIGSVGQHLCKLVSEEGASLVLTDINHTRLVAVAKEFGAHTVSPEEIYGADVDIFAPCAMGAILNDSTIPQLKAKIVAGAANNQLADENKHSVQLTERHIVYCPDYVINAGGLINVYHELIGYNAENAKSQAQKIFGTTKLVIEKSRSSAITTHQAARALAEERIAGARGLRHLATLETSPIMKMKR
jgi:leucine dehydrogenase